MLTEKHVKPRVGEWVVIGAVCMVIAACGVAVWQRDALRAWWWARGLAAAPTQADQTYYFTMLAAVREKGVRAERSLLRHPRPEMRLMGAALLAKVADPGAADGLTEALDDKDEAVRDAAAVGLAFSNAKTALPILRARIANAPPTAAVAMSVAIGRMEGDDAEHALFDIAQHHSNPNVRGQAAEMIGLRGGSSGRAVLAALSRDLGRVDIELYGRRLAMEAGHYASATRASSVAATQKLMTVGAVAEEALRAKSKLTTSQEGLGDGHG